MYVCFFRYFRGYVSGRLECLSVGVRRFPVDIVYPKALLGMHKNGRKVASAIDQLAKNHKVMPHEITKMQYQLTHFIVTNLVKQGTGVLVFVSGINDIVELSEKFDGLAGYSVYVIHSEIPFEEQEAAFLPTPPDVVKVILATNAAESSITLPDVDVVVCLGTHKALEYNAISHRVNLVNSWISKASATQRAGRTGRVRPGTVYRVYSEFLHNNFEEFDSSEIRRTPLHDIILNLRHMLEKSENFQGIKPVLEDLLEAPDLINVENSFQYLYEEGMITEPDDSGELTTTGDLVAQLPVDCQLGKLISYGIRLGCAVECIVMAAALMQPKKLFRIASPLVHKDPDVLSEIVRNTTHGAFMLDGGVFSEPIMYVVGFLIGFH
jgi:HrpA-like RNA helicase